MEINKTSLNVSQYSSEEEKEDIEGIQSINQNKNKKDLVKVDHSAVSYQPFRKNFYIEVPELARMTQAEVETYRCEMEGITVKGKGVPKPIQTWAQAGVSKKELETLKKLGFEKPTPIQAQAIPAIMSGRDLIGIAKTGSGKTLAFLLPMFRHILDQPPLEETDGPIGLSLELVFVFLILSQPALINLVLHCSYCHGTHQRIVHADRKRCEKVL